MQTCQYAESHSWREEFVGLTALIEMNNLVGIICRRWLIWRAMKETEELQKGIQQLVDLTKADELNSKNLIKMPELALVMSKYFVSLGKLCLTHYHSYARERKRQLKSEENTNGKEEQQNLINLKKPVTAYILYFQERVPFFQEKYPKYIISQLTRLIAKEWKEISAQAKKPYIDRANADKKRYEEEKINLKMKKKFQKIDLEEKNRKAEESEQSIQSQQKEGDLKQQEGDDGI